MAAVACLAAGAPALFADVVTSVSCSTLGALNNGFGACSAVGPYGYANATASGTVTLPTSASQAAEIGVASDVAAVLQGVRGIGNESTAQSSSQVTVNFDTHVPVQSGYLELTFQQNAYTVPSFGSASESLSIGSYSVSLAGQNLNSVFLPVQLGTEFTLDFLQSLVGNGDAGSGPASGSIQSIITLQAFQADKSTAVELFDPPSAALTVATPEPASSGMMSVALFAALLLIHLVRHKS